MGEINDPLAALDQVRAASADLAGLVAAYRRQLIEAGLPTMEVLALVIAYQSSLLSNAAGGE